MNAKKRILVGYAMKTRGYKVWIPEDREFIETINVKFGRQSSGCSVLELKCPKYSCKKIEDKEVILKNDPQSDSDTKDECLIKEFFEKVLKDLKSENSESETQKSENDSHTENSPKKPVTQICKVVLPPHGSRMDIYYTVNPMKTMIKL